MIIAKREAGHRFCPARQRRKVYNNASESVAIAKLAEQLKVLAQWHRTGELTDQVYAAARRKLRAEPATTTAGGLKCMEDPIKAHRATLTLESYWKALDECGWLAELSPEQQDEIYERFEAYFAGKRRSDICYGLSTFGFDAEAIYDEGPNTISSYWGLLHEFAEASGGRFAPTEVEDHLDPPPGYERIHVSFQHGGRRYQASVENSKWFQPEVLKLINQALADSQVAQRFISLPAIDQIERLVFVPEATYRCALKLRLIPPLFYWDTWHETYHTRLEQFYAELDRET
jgi:hypothetical protein